MKYSANTYAILDRIADILTQNFMGGDPVLNRIVEERYEALRQRYQRRCVAWQRAYYFPTYEKSTHSFYWSTYCNSFLLSCSSSKGYYFSGLNMESGIGMAWNNLEENDKIYLMSVLLGARNKE